MKETLSTAMLAALLGGGGAFAGTTVEGYDEEYSKFPDAVYGKYATEFSACLAYMRIKEDESSPYPMLGTVIGGYVKSSSGDAVVSDNTIVMTSGEANSVYGGLIHGEGGSYYVNANTVIMTGGSAYEVYGGSAGGGDNVVADNKVVVTGGSCGFIRSACIFSGHKSKVVDNAVLLVGEGAQYTYNGGDGGQTVYEGGNIHVGMVSAASVEGDVDSYGNSLNISGTGIQVGRVGTDFMRLNFHLVAAQLAGTAPMVTITESKGFSLTTDMILSFDAMEGMEWRPGTSVTLVEAQKGMIIAPEVLAKEYNIYRNGDQETIMATARLVLEDSQNSTQLLKLAVQGVPEPATGTLGLLALAALASRRRRK